MPVTFRHALERVSPYQPGKPVEQLKRELGLTGPILKLASNEGAWGPVPAACEAIAAAIAEGNRYPDGSCHELRQALAEKHGVSADMVVVGNGADAVLDYLSQALYEPGDEVAFCWPSFPVYPINATKMGAEPKTAPLAGSAYDLEALAAIVGPRTKAVYVTNPNNPTGGFVGREALLRFLDALPDHVVPVVDEAYFEFVSDPDYPDASRWVAEGRPLVVIRTFSKIYGMAGMRVGYGLMPADLAVACNKVKGAFDVSHVAQVGALASLRATEEIDRRRNETTAGRAALAEGFRTRGFEPLPSVANFVTVQVGDGVRYGAELERQGVIVRPLAGFGDPSSIRVTVGTPDEIDRFFAAFDEARKGIAT